MTEMNGSMVELKTLHVKKIGEHIRRTKIIGTMSYSPMPLGPEQSHSFFAQTIMNNVNVSKRKRAFFNMILFYIVNLTLIANITHVITTTKQIQLKILMHLPKLN